MSENIVSRVHDTLSVGRVNKWWNKGYFTTVVTLALTNLANTVTVGHLWQTTKNVLWTEAVLNIPAGGTQVVDTIALTDAKTGKWILRFNAGSNVASSEVMGHIGKSGAPAWAQAFLLGDRINYSVFTSTDGSNLFLNITNNTAGTLAVWFRRTAV